MVTDDWFKPLVDPLRDICIPQGCLAHSCSLVTSVTPRELRAVAALRFAGLYPVGEVATCADA